MRGPKINIVVSVAFTGDLTARQMISVGNKLNSAPIQTLVQQVRKKHLHQFRLDLGDGLIVEYPAGDGLKIKLK